MDAPAIALLIALAIPAVPAVKTDPPGLPVLPPESEAVPAFIQRVVPAVVGIRAEIPLDRPSAATLGPFRTGTGVIFDPSGHVLTVNYLIMDAAVVRVALRDGRIVPARVVGTDFETGLGVVALESAGPWPSASFGDSSKISAGQRAAIMGVDGDNDVVYTQGNIREIRSFTGYWEYLLDRAFIVAPHNPWFGGSPLVNTEGEIIGVTNLRLGDPPQGNVAVPVEHFLSIKDELIAEGRVKSRRPRPWLGLYTLSSTQGVIVVGASPVGPAAAAGFERGDVIVRLNGEGIESQEDFYKKLWMTEVGQELSVEVLRESGFEVIRLRSVNRYELRGPAGK
jgi:S1-C subfamily serine protease